MSEEMVNGGKILLYQNGAEKEVVNVVFHDENFWLTQKGMAELFGVKVPAISKHLKNIFLDEELDESMVVSRLNRLVTMFIDYAELMAEDEQLMSMQDWLRETDRFLANNRRQVLDGKGHISREAAVKQVSSIYEEFRKRQDADYISEFDRQTEKYLKGE